MFKFQYKGRIHKSKLSVRSLRYAMADQAARAFPRLQKRWTFPVEAMPIGDAAAAENILASYVIRENLPEVLQVLGLKHDVPLSIFHHIYTLENIVVTGWAGAMMKNGLLLTIRPRHNWVSALRAHPHRVTHLDSARPYFNLMAAATAKGHIFHWLYDAIIPLLSYLEQGGQFEKPGLIVNATRTEIQTRTLDFLRQHYGILHIHAVPEREAAFVPRLITSIPKPHIPRALQAPQGLAKIDALGDFLASGAARVPASRIYISRNDARLRRVLDEDALMGCLGRHGVERVILKGMPIPDQVRLFRNAELIVAPHGAGLAHITWCRPQTKIVEFFPDPIGPRGRVRNATSDYWIISQMRSLDYSCVFGGQLLNRDDGFMIGENNLSEALNQSLLIPSNTGIDG